MINCGDSGDQGGEGGGDGDGVRAGGGDGSGGDGGGDQENISPASSSIKVSSSSRTFGAELEQEFADLEIPRLRLARAAASSDAAFTSSTFISSSVNFLG